MDTRELRTALEDKFGVDDRDPYQGGYWGETEGVSAFYSRLANSNTIITVDGIGDFEKVEYLAPYGEGGSIEAQLVFTFEDKYYRVEGTLDSWAGGVWDSGPYEVYPKKKTITVYDVIP